MEQLLEVIFFTRYDGEEVSLEESSIGQILEGGDTVGYEEIVLQVPD